MTILPLVSVATVWPTSPPPPPKPRTHGPAAVVTVPACVTVNVWPAMLSVPVRELALVLAVTHQVTAPLPLPLAGVQVSQAGALLDGVQLQPAPAVTVRVALLAAEPTLLPVGGTVYVQVAPTCVTVNVWPATLSVPVRELPVLAATE